MQRMIETFFHVRNTIWRRICERRDCALPQLLAVDGFLGCSPASEVSPHLVLGTTYRRPQNTMHAELRYGTVPLSSDTLPPFTRTAGQSFDFASAKRGNFGQREPCPGRSLGPSHAVADGVTKKPMAIRARKDSPELRP